MSERPLEIRRARLSEAEALSALALRSKAVWGYDDAFLALCRAELTVQPQAIESGEVWVAEDAGQPVGLLELVMGDGEAEIRLIFVAPERLGAGVGAALWSHAETRANTRGAALLTLDADPNAVGFYERMGMRIVGYSASGSIPGRMLPRMRKALHPDSRAFCAVSRTG